jgi:hypothetical protein
MLLFKPLQLPPWEFLPASANVSASTSGEASMPGTPPAPFVSPGCVEGANPTAEEFVWPFGPPTEREPLGVCVEELPAWPKQERDSSWATCGETLMRPESHGAQSD